jgi:hypothetical protein
MASQSEGRAVNKNQLCCGGFLDLSHYVLGPRNRTFGYDSSGRRQYRQPLIDRRNAFAVQDNRSVTSEFIVQGTPLIQFGKQLSQI